MGAHLITGHAGKAHVSSEDQGLFHAVTIGPGKYVFDTGSLFAYELISNNLIKIKDGALLNQGRYINILPNDYEEIMIDNGIAGVNRNDLIVMRYSKNAETSIETASVVLIKGVSGDSATDPEYVQGDILAGELQDDFPLYRVRITGINVEGVDALFTPGEVMALSQVREATEEDMDEITKA